MLLLLLLLLLLLSSVSLLLLLLLLLLPTSQSPAVNFHLRIAMCELSVRQALAVDEDEPPQAAHARLTDALQRFAIRYRESLPLWQAVARGRLLELEEDRGLLKLIAWQQPTKLLSFIVSGCRFSLHFLCCSRIWKEIEFAEYDDMEEEVPSSNLVVIPSSSSSSSSSSGISSSSSSSSSGSVVHRCYKIAACRR
jgi:hypothetical protein